MAKTVKDLVPGDQMAVIRHYANNPGPHMMTVESVGRLWINFQGGCLRVDKQTLKGEMLTAYLEMSDYEKHLRIVRLRSDLKKQISEATPDQLEEIAKIMGIEGAAEQN